MRREKKKLDFAYSSRGQIPEIFFLKKFQAATHFHLIYLILKPEYISNTYNKYALTFLSELYSNHTSPPLDV